MQEESRVTTPLRLLMLEDSTMDAELNEHMLRRAGIDFTSLRVDTLPDFTAALADFHPDLILADYHLPGFNGMDALTIARDQQPNIPFLFVSGAMGEELAVSSIKQGATDYIIKDRLARLPAAVHRALDEARNNTQRRESEERFHKIADAAQDAIIMMDAEHHVSFWNHAAERIFGYTAAEALGQDMHLLIAPPAAREGFARGWQQFLATGEGAVIGKVTEVTAMRKGGSEFPAEIAISGTRVNGQMHAIGIARDISERVAREQQLRQLNRVLRTISACNQSLVRARNEAELLQTICRDLIDVGGYLLAWVAFPDAAPGGALRAGVHHGDETAFGIHAELEHETGHSAHCLLWRALREKHTIVHNSLSGMREPGYELLSQAGVGAKLAMPLQAGDEILGVLTIFARQIDAFDAAEIALIEELGADLAYGIAALRTGEERDRYLQRSRQAMQNIVAAIARTLEMRDPYTAGHQQRVTTLAQAIAAEMGLDEQIVEGLYFGAMIHDIGKIAVPAEILSKPGRLTSLEYQLIQQHPATGLSIVEDIDFPWPVAEMVVQHHERLDGSGYPEQMTGDTITLEARILAVADVVEAMASHRPYRASLGMDAALTEIEAGSGTRYDPAVVAACVRVVRANDMKLPES